MKGDAGDKPPSLIFWNKEKKVFTTLTLEDGSLELTLGQLPPEEGSVQGLTNSYAIPINGGSEFILYSGDKVSTL
jgi:hypothetical protein